MKKLFIPIISITLYMQQAQSMEVIADSDDNGYEVIIKDLQDCPAPITLSRKRNHRSEQLFNRYITEPKIRQLVQDGAELNYIKTVPGWNIPLVFFFASNDTAQGIKNMKTIIDLGAAIHNLKNEEETPLTIAVHKNLTNMIQFLMPYEDPAVTIYPSLHITGEMDDKARREMIISTSFAHQNIMSIRSLLNLKLMSPNRGLKEYCYWKQENPAILNLLLERGANNGGELLPELITKAFPNDQYIKFLRTICASGAFDEEVLERIQPIKKDVDNILLLLASNKQNNS